MSGPVVTAADRRCGEHRPGIGREWCYDDGEWCYENAPCRGCTLVAIQARVAALEQECERLRELAMGRPY